MGPPPPAPADAHPTIPVIALPAPTIAPFDPFADIQITDPRQMRAARRMKLKTVGGMPLEVGLTELK